MQSLLLLTSVLLLFPTETKHALAKQRWVKLLQFYSRIFSQTTAFHS